MDAEQRGANLSALFVDYDNVYLSLKRRNEEAAGRFAQDPARWLARIISGQLVRSNAPESGAVAQRRIIVSRVYGNPVPRRSGRDAGNDPNSFIFIRHHFIRAGFEVIDCPPLTTQLKNGADIRMAIDIVDFLEHKTRFEEFIILSGDADFTHVLHRIRSFDRRTVIYANDHTAASYAALCDGHIDESDLVSFLLEDALPPPEQSRRGSSLGYFRESALASRLAPRTRQAGGIGRNEEPTIRALVQDFEIVAQEILALVIDVVNSAEKPVPIAYLANRAMKDIGHAKTVGTNWAGSGGFLNFLSLRLPDNLRLTQTPPHSVYDPARHRVEETDQQHATQNERSAAPPRTGSRADVVQAGERSADSGQSEMRRSVTRICEASKAPPLPPSTYQLIFNLISAEVAERGFHPERTVSAVVSRAAQSGIQLGSDEVAFVLTAVDEMDPWLERSQTAQAIARTYRDTILSRCKAAGLRLTDDEYQLIEVWFGPSQLPVAGPGTEATHRPGGMPRRGETERDEPPPSSPHRQTRRAEIPVLEDLEAPLDSEHPRDPADSPMQRNFGIFKRQG